MSLETARQTIHTAKSNFGGVVMTSLVVAVTALPFLGSTFLGAVPAALGGLWTSCLLFGVALVGLFRFAAAAADGGVGTAPLPQLAAAVKRPRVGFELGAITFVLLVVMLATVVTPDGIRTTVVGIVMFVLTCWYLVVALAAPELASGASTTSALRTGASRFGRSPVTAGWFLGLSVISAVLTGVTVVTVVVLLPGVLGILAIYTARSVAREPSDCESAGN